jgi:hypothetical protein
LHYILISGKRYFLGLFGMKRASGKPDAFIFTIPD